MSLAAPETFNHDPSVPVYEGGPTFAVKLLCGTDTARFQVNDVPQNSWFGILFGETMRDNELVLFGAGEEARVDAMYSGPYYYPEMLEGGRYEWTAEF